MNSEHTALVSAALDYAQRGWLVVPLHSAIDGRCSCGDPACRPRGKHPRTRHGLKDAAIDAEQIRRWWRNWPDANVGVVTGAISKFVVLDVDGERGRASLEHLKNAHGWVPNTLTSLTGKGHHLLFVHPGQPVRNRVSSDALGEGLDVRGDGGYIVAPPSVHPSGTQYRWEEREKQITALPDWLLARMTEPQHRTLPEVLPALPQGEVITEGKRNTALTSAAGLLRWAGLDPLEIEALLRIHNDVHCDPPLSESELARIAKSIGQKRPGRTNPDIWWWRFERDKWLAGRNHRLMHDYQRGWLIELLAQAWGRGGTLPFNMEELPILASADSPDQFREEYHLVLDEFELHELSTGSLLVHPDMAKWFLSTVTKCFQNRESGKRGGKRSAERREKDRREGEPFDDGQGEVA